MNDDRFSAYGPILVMLFFFSIVVLNAGKYQPAEHEWEGVLPDTVRQQIESGEVLYRRACANCHGIKGGGAVQSQLGFSTPVPDFTDCNFATREPDADWIAVAHQGGPTRGFSTDMPAFGEALTTEELQRIMDYIRTFCADDDWPRGELNLPRPLVTEKAYPEDEAVLSSFINMENEGAVMNEIVYETRFGARNQLELVVPFGFREAGDGSWNGGQLGDLAVGVKRALYHDLSRGTIISVTGEYIFPTGDRGTGFGKGTTLFEPFVSVGQLLPADGFLHFQGGMEIPFIKDKATEEVFWRAALGKTVAQGAWGRAWSPMVEVLGARELESGAQNQWDLVPQLQVTLNQRQHIMMNVGARIPVDDSGRDTQFMVYILWDWFDGGLFEGW
ncbi:c-type cytochrome [Fodinibius sediminis]|uniref:Cytochrome C oxidase, cbb3-type, subunit III n=1 Tax=Fodinibius sediminis TaxID=1214077 RepID=A0A521BE60_9BACT|nr:c-type cytochrome [Fodinibius sediminis]SMO45261.1 Cytochrome C oxidase, cbb3-type, subunit III [Fodinibius sediminis]